ncbi:MAG: hypothetical protein OJF47_000715 [Nitrospira sp.]|jgi:FkbM family methyltransferase|nr:MAG: hypothetical protein OJF47_000715 [Nitrospira sp.]
MSFLNVLKFITSHPLNKDHKLKAIFRFARWQVISRLGQGEITYDWVNGSRFLVRAGETALTGNIYTGLFEFPDMAFLLHVLRAEDLFIDVGANVGSYSILACSAIGARGYAFEPIPSTYSRLINNIHLNHLENRTKCLNIGIGREEGSLAFSDSMGACNHALAPGERCVGTTVVNVSTLDTVLKDESPDLMKIDVEGYETPVLQGAEATLKKQTLHSVIMELNGNGLRYGFDELFIIEMMFDYGFRTFSYDPIGRTLISLEGKNLTSGNTIFIRDKMSVIERLRTSPPVTIHGRKF